jgi:TM2 domain-containing membrane protein YozV
MAKVSGKSPVVAVILSFFFAGLGQFYAGDIGKGVMFIIVDLVCGVLDATVVGLFFSIPIYFVFWIWSMVSAYKACKPQA